MRVDVETGDIDIWSEFDRRKEPERDLHKFILQGHDTGLNFSGREVVYDRFAGSQRQENVFLEPMDHQIIGKPEAKVEATVTASWGGKEPAKVETSVSASVSDGHNKGRIEYTATSDGDQKVSATVSQESGSSVDNHTGQDQR